MALLAAGLPAAAGTASAASGYDDAVDITLPVQGTYSNDYHAGRSGGRLHRATDIFNDAGTPVRAAVGGTVSWAPASEHATAGFALQIQGDDGRTYAYYHLGTPGGSRSRALASGIDIGVRVERSQVIGYLGNSGNARNTRPHLHFEIHDSSITDPTGSHRVNPYAALRAAESSGGGSSSSGGGASGGSPAATYTVRAGDTLSKIARGLGLGSWRVLHDLNPSLDNPNLIYPGQKLRTSGD